MTVKETIVQILMEEGYDLISACDKVEKFLSGLQEYPKGIYTFYSKTKKIRIEKK